MRFYGETLGLPLLPRPAFNFPGAWYALGAQELHLIVDTTNYDERRTSHFALLVTDAVAAHAELTRRGVTGMQGPGLRPDGVIQVYLRDPDGNQIEITSPPV